MKNILMMNKYILDFELLKVNNIELIHFITLIEISENIESGLLFNSNEIYDHLQDNKFIKIIEDLNNYRYILREKGKQLVESCIYKEYNNEEIINIKPQQISKIVKESENFNEFVKEYRNLWKGLKVGSQGSLKSVNDKLQRWMKENPDYSQEDILRAARTYINSLDDFKYLQQADYFIYKKDKYGEQSRLSTFIDEDEIIEEGWGSQLK